MAVVFLILWLGIGGGGGYAALEADAPGWVVAVLLGGSALAAVATTSLFSRWRDQRVYLTADEKKFVREQENAKSPATHKG